MCGPNSWAACRHSPSGWTAHALPAMAPPNTGTKHLAHFLNSDRQGRRSHLETPVDFLDAMEELVSSDFLNPVYREKTLIP